MIAQLKDHGSVTRGWIGVQIQPVTQDIADSLGLKKAEGALVAEPQDNSPAKKAGIEAGDVITAVNGEQVKDARDLARKIGALAPKATVKLVVLHKGSEKTISLTLGELPNTKQANAATDDSNGGDNNGAIDMGKLGLTLAPASRVAGAGGEGVVVTGVDGSGVAAEHGFSTGDVILEVAGKSVSTPADVRKVVASARTEGKRTVLLRVKSGDNTRFVALAGRTRLIRTHDPEKREPVFGKDHAQDTRLRASRRHPSPPLASRPHRGRAATPVPPNSRKARGSHDPDGFRTELHPGIRRPRWGGVVEGVAGLPPPPLRTTKRQTHAAR